MGAIRTLHTLHTLRTLHTLDTLDTLDTPYFCPDATPGVAGGL
jgi:hypothetical protein